MYNKLLYIEISKDDNLIRLNMILETYFYKIITLNNDNISSYNLNYPNIFNDMNEKNNSKEKKDIENINKNKLLTSKSIDNIEILDDKYKSNKFYQCNKFINKCCIF